MYYKVDIAVYSIIYTYSPWIWKEIKNAIKTLAVCGGIHGINNTITSS